MEQYFQLSYNVCKQYIYKLTKFSTLNHLFVSGYLFYAHFRRCQTTPRKEKYFETDSRGGGIAIV